MNPRHDLLIASPTLYLLRHRATLTDINNWQIIILLDNWGTNVQSRYAAVPRLEAKPVTFLPNPMPTPLAHK